MNRKLILLNGCPRCGKDTAADYLVHSLGAHAFKFSRPIKDAIKAAFQLSDVEVDVLEATKSKPTELFSDMSYRDIQISFSEDWLKPKLGQDIFGRLAARSLAKTIKMYPNNQLFVSSDSGFAAEAEPVIDLFGRENTLLIRVYRDGFSFEGDSRSYIDLPGVTRVSVTNNGSVLEYQDAVRELVLGWAERTPLNE
jgi:hypothetical protein